ncbi:MAG TPA: hypothetical protein GXZ39_02595, partial [Bacteroidales bacterium]|nr:hypothetical protein [Bacteroidales bacterium]
YQGDKQAVFYFFLHKSLNLGTIMNLQYITDTKGHKSAVQLPMKDWEQIQKDLDELERLRNKKLFMTELAEAVEEMKLIKEGKVQARNAEDFLNEL